MVARLLLLGAQDRELLGEHARALLEPGELVGEVHAHEQQEADRDEEQRGRRVVDPQEVRHAVEDARERGEDEHRDPDEHPEQRVLAAHLAPVQEPEQEERARQHDEQHEHVRAGRQADRGELRIDADHWRTLRSRRGRDKCPTGHLDEQPPSGSTQAGPIARQTVEEARAALRGSVWAPRSPGSPRNRLPGSNDSVESMNSTGYEPAK